MGSGRRGEGEGWEGQLTTGQISPLETPSPRLVSPPLQPRRSPGLSSSWLDAWTDEEEGQGGEDRVMTALTSMTDNLFTGDSDP